MNLKNASGIGKLVSYLLQFYMIKDMNIQSKQRWSGWLLTGGLKLTPVQFTPFFVRNLSCPFHKNHFYLSWIGAIESIEWFLASLSSALNVLCRLLVPRRGAPGAWLGKAALESCCVIVAMKMTFREVSSNIFIILYFTFYIN